MTGSSEHSLDSIPAMKVHQWFEQWSEYRYDVSNHQAQPQPHFYLFSLPAVQLRRLSGVQQRTTSGGLKRSQDQAFQRKLDKGRSDEIRQFIQYGYPWSQMSPALRESGRYDSLRKPGWLPTAVVVNILKPEDTRRMHRLRQEDAMKVEDLDFRSALIHMPFGFGSEDWQPQDLPPIEIIDGQHRLWAFDEEISDGVFEMPVVAFHGLDTSWQAYLFWTINITPKRINQSLAYDLYPLLRAEDWLERFEGPAIYRETRAQELVELLWSYHGSPWYQRINMLGETGQRTVSQAAWIRAITATYMRRWEGRGPQGMGGLFGAKAGEDQTVLPWVRLQQAAFLIYVWKALEQAIRVSNAPWAQELRSQIQPTLSSSEADTPDLAFIGPFSLLNSDQGVRGILYVTNDLYYIQYLRQKLDLERWSTQQDLQKRDEEIIDDAIQFLTTDDAIASFTEEIAEVLAGFDWRSADAPSLEADAKTMKLAFRGSGGYRELRRQLLHRLADSEGEVGKTAQIVLDILKV